MSKAPPCVLGTGDKTLQGLSHRARDNDPVSLRGVFVCGQSHLTRSAV